MVDKNNKKLYPGDTVELVGNSADFYNKTGIVKGMHEEHISVHVDKVGFPLQPGEYLFSPDEVLKY